jgi:hypothetical protein
MSNRLSSLDFLKGFGIITFIVWHSYAYFYKYPQGYSSVHRITIYATGLFIFLSGFLVGNHYYPKLVKTKDIALITKRLLARAVKLTSYVVIANLLVAVLLERRSIYGAFVDTFRNLFSLVNKDRWDISLQILIVIALGLLCTLPIIILHERYGNRSSYIFLILLAGLYVFDAFYSEHLPYLWRYLPLSIAGSLLGLFLTGDYKRNTILACGLTCLIIATSLCVASALSSRCYDYILVETGPYAILIVTIFMAIGSLAYYILDLRKNMPFWLKKSLIIAGQQSLFIYIVQIVMIRLFALFLGANMIASDSKIVALAATIFLGCVALSNLVDWSRKYTLVDKLYRFLFA